MKKIAIIGSGITAAVTVHLLKQKIPYVDITIWEKARGVGGRMCTTRSSNSDVCSVDLGAQYITKSETLTETQEKCYQKLCQDKLLKPLSGYIEGMNPKYQKFNHYICPNGSGSVVKYFIEKSGCAVCFNRQLVEVMLSETTQWTLKANTSEEEKFDIVVFTIPVPQILQINNLVKYLNASDVQNLQKVKYNSRFALGLFYDKVLDYEDIPWVAKYFDNNSSIRFLSYDNMKRGLPSSLTSVVVHSTKEFGAKQIENSFTNVEALLLNDLKQIMPILPSPSYIKTHKWRYSQIEEVYIGKPGCIAVKKDPLLIFGGDSFTTSTFEGCVLSAEKIVETVIQNI